MTFCEREPEVLEVLRTGRWPEQWDAGLRKHVTSCARCADLVEVASALLTENKVSQSIRVPSSGAVWWRTQRRARANAARVTTRAMSVVQGITVVIGAFIAFSLLDMWTTKEWITFAQHLIATVAQWGLPIVLLLVAWIALAPVALYLAVSKD